MAKLWDVVQKADKKTKPAKAGKTRTAAPSRKAVMPPALELPPDAQLLTVATRPPVSALDDPEPAVPVTEGDGAAGEFPKMTSVLVRLPTTLVDRVEVERKRLGLRSRNETIVTALDAWLSK